MNENVMQPTKRGDPITAKGYSELVRRSKRKITGHDVVETAYGWHIRQRREDEDRILVLNSGGFTVPAFGIAEITGFDSTKNKFIIGRPTSDDDPNTVIVAGADISDGSEGYVFDDKGTHQILAPGAVRDDVVGSQVGSFDGAVSNDGSYLVRAVSGGDVFATPFRCTVLPVKGVIPFASYQFVNDQVPDLVQGLPTTMVIALTIGDPPNDRIERGVAKFATPVVLSGVPAVSIVLATMRFYSVRTENFSSPGEGDNADGTHKITIFKITEDFDETALTFNNYDDLTKSEVGSFAMRIIARGSGEVVFGVQSDSGANTHPSWEQTFPISGTMFGLAFESSAAFTIGNRANQSFQFTRTSSSGGYIVVDPFG